MRILLDNGVPRGVTTALRDHIAEEARAHGWDTLKNGELLTAAEAAGFDLFVTTDKNIRHQQKMAGRTIAILILGSGRWTLIKLRLTAIAATVATMAPGTIVEMTF